MSTSDIIVLSLAFIFIAWLIKKAIQARRELNATRKDRKKIAIEIDQLIKASEKYKNYLYK